MPAVPQPYDVSPTAVKALRDAFWGPGGWRSARGEAPDPLPQAALDAGLMFAEPRRLDHDGWVDAARRAAAATDLHQVGTAFVASLTSGRLDLRSALASYAVARHLPDHPWAPRGPSRACRVCGMHQEPGTVDLNALNAERFLWGGVRHGDLTYVTFDLEQFALAPPLPPTAADVALGRALLAALGSCPADATVAGLSASLTFLRGNKAQRRSLLEALGIAGVLAAPGHPGFRDGFVDAADREEAPGHWMETAYPACWWRGADGLDAAAIAEFLPQLT